MKRGGPLRRRAVLVRQATKRRKPAGLPQPLRARVLDRDLWTCQGCGRGPAGIRDAALRLEVHHRLPKGRGGKDRIENLVTTCGFGNAAGCHGRVDEDRAWAVGHGLVLLTGQDPAWVPVTDHAGRMWWLGVDGSKRLAEDGAA